ncbi:MAG: SsrA-binding protein, partial [Candidatus Peregrinibacteria bacterium]|nr:SsrA-binding protein [Candidatus Peregrinibacteria bacterium]
RKRKLLLNKREIAKLEHQSGMPGITVIPLKVFLKKNLIKIVIGVGRGKKKYDKRESIKSRDVDRQLRQNNKNR